MSNLIPRTKLDAIEKLLAEGDLAPMVPAQRLDYMRSMCKLLGISMLGQPFDFIKLNGKVQMYANAKCGSQLRAVYKISLKVVARERVDGLYVVTSEARTGKGREDSSIGAINIKGLSGEALANAMMKAETKSKRRVTMSLCGLGMLDADTAKELAEMEAKQATERAVEETHEKIADTTARPEFETETQAPSPSVVKAPPTDQGYVMKAGKNRGKLLKDMPLIKLKKWMEWYNKQVESKADLHPDVQDDAFNVIAHLEGPPA